MKFPEMKYLKLMVTTLIVLMTSVSFAQTYNNEWIDYSKTYYKFKVGRDGLFRIMGSTLATVGLENVDARDFKLVRNGQEVPIYTSAAAGPLAGGYIEFWGEKNDGKPDKALYRLPAYQHSDKISLETDTSTYFLTRNVGANLRLNDRANDVATGSATLPVEPYFLYTNDVTFRDRLNPGIAAVVQEYVYSSSYDKGEFYSTREIRTDTPSYDASYKIIEPNLFVNTSGGPSKFKFGAFGNALNVREVTVKLNGSDIVTGTAGLMDYFNDMIREVNVPTSLLSSNTANIEFHNLSPVKTDRMVVSFYQLTYPRNFNFGGAKNFAFELPAKAGGYYLEIDNFSYGVDAPVLYDYANGQRYIGNISTPGKVKFYLPGTGGVRKLRLINQEASSISFINSLTSKNFVDFTNAARQGDYLIITSPYLYTGSAGNNPIEDYKSYRSSISGGGFKVAIIETPELIDQFAFGIKSHPSAVKNFLSFARAKFPVPLKNVLLIGKGVNYTESRTYEASPILEKLNLVPPFGYPGSDNMLGSANSTNPISETPIGRLSVVKGVEVESYLEKVKEYETVQRTAPNTLAGKLWMKNTMEVTGSSDQYLGTQLCSYMEGYKFIVMDSLSGLNVNVFCKNSVVATDQFSGDRISRLFEDGLSMLTYFGHSSSTTLEFNIDNPENYNNQGKYPIFSVNGCNAGDFFRYDPERFGFSLTLSEKFTLAKQRGGIAFIASTHYGIVNYLNIYINALFENIATKKYNASVGELCRSSLQTMVNAVGSSDFYARLHAEEITLHGDPALKTNAQSKPDYIIEESQVKISPTFIAVSDNNFDVAIKIHNMGKAIADSIIVEVKRQYPDGSMATLVKQKMRGIYYADSINLRVPVSPNRDKGLNKLIVTLDSENAVDEIAEYNNTVTKEFFIYEDEARPIYPYNYSIVNNTTQKLYASTANPFSTLKNYAVEIDSTELFNSPVKKQIQISSVGGLLEFDSQMAFRDSTVYYWRVALVPASGGEYRWNTSSFVYLKNSSAGSNQSHFFQHKKSDVSRIKIDADRNWKFGDINNTLYVRNTMYPTGGTENNQFMVVVNGQDMFISACLGRSILFNVIDPSNFRPWKNVDDNGVSLNASGSASNCNSGRSYNFEFSYMNEIERKKIMNFMDSIPDGFFVIARSFDYSVPASYSSTWQADTLLYGRNNSVYHRLLNAGFAAIDSINAPRAWSLVYKKNDPTFQPKYDYTEGIYDQSLVLADCLTKDTAGFVTSPVFGPAKSWTNVHWRGKSAETISTDRVSIDVIGVNSSGNETLLQTLDGNTQDADISSVDANQFPFMKLKMATVDSVNFTPYQLNYWRINYQPVPEGALAPNIYFEGKDTLEIGENFKFGIAFKNVSPNAFDSLKLKFAIIDKDNIRHDILFNKQKPLISGDTVTFKYEVDTKMYPGANTIFLDYNPDNDQPEQMHFNNFLYKNFYVKFDNVNPLLDITFDGVHILNRDIVSSKPHIQIKLKDESKFQLLNDTSVITTLQVKYPDQNQTIRTYKFGTDTLKFIPAQSGADNTAIIEFTPYFPTITDQNNQPLNPEGDEYELFVRGKDKSGNKAGDIDYHVSFRVIDKPMISNLLNYPNPFTTSTAFVFTITGSEIPENIKIQILTVTGKIVREITKDELGPLHIGRNITEYKWDGNDQYGQRLANGVYLYRVVTTLKGSRMQKFTDKGDDTDRYFNKGYGKMYLMR